MEGIREIATAYYERASEQEKKEAEELFKTLDRNGDGKVTLLELKMASLGSWISNENIFKKLDKNGDRSLDFYEFLAVHYMVKKDVMLVCSGCFNLLVGPYFSCLLCVGNGPDTFDLCCNCHRAGVIAHEHSSEYLLDHHSLLYEMRKRTTELAESSRGSRGKREMEELREIARTHYEASSPEVQTLAYEFFRSMDTDGDGRVDISEFFELMRHEGYSHMHSPRVFKELDLDGNGTLDFWEVMTLYYIIKSGRPLCDLCGNFIPGIFFSCVECFKNPETSFDLCHDCYRSTNWNHNHGGRAQFLDNHTLLQAQRVSALTQTTGLSSSSNQHWNSTSSFVPAQQRSYMYTNPNPNRSNAIIPAPYNKIAGQAAFLALEWALDAAISAALCTIM